ncbi:MAG: LLM class flavin-dependent oxidoreductase [Gammaproteobacteria bacterium]|nr:LLM class flavin-dependent oxidoreductase [Gammaproteobacteria bacterium]
MQHPLRFYVLVLPTLSWPQLVERFQYIEALGFDLAGLADHFVDWGNPPGHWYELTTWLAGVAQATSRIRLLTSVAQIPLRDPATFANQALTVDHISNGRLEVGLGIGVRGLDPSYRMMGLADWTNRERVERFGEYVEVLDLLLRQDISDYRGKYYQLDGAVMSPRPIQRPRPPIMVAAMGPKMLAHAARRADIWNSMSFAADVGTQLQQTRERAVRIDDLCAGMGRDPATLIRSYHMFDPSSRSSGGAISYYASVEAFEQLVGQVLELGITDIGLYYPSLAEQVSTFERIATDVIPAMKSRHAN